MWVKSQDEKLIINTDNLIGFEVDGRDDTEWSLKAITTNNSYRLGYYKKEEDVKRALRDIFNGVSYDTESIEL